MDSDYIEYIEYIETPPAQAVPAKAVKTPAEIIEHLKQFHFHLSEINNQCILGGIPYIHVDSKTFNELVSEAKIKNEKIKIEYHVGNCHAHAILDEKTGLEICALFQ